MARCHRPEWLAAVRKERLMTEQRLATAKGHHSQLTVEKGKAHIRLSFGRPLYPATRPELIQNRNARWRGRKCRDPWQRYAVPHPSLLRASHILVLESLPDTPSCGVGPEFQLDRPLSGSNPPEREVKPPNDPNQAANRASCGAISGNIGSCRWPYGACFRSGPSSRRSRTAPRSAKFPISLHIIPNVTRGYCGSGRIAIRRSTLARALGSRAVFSPSFS